MIDFDAPDNRDPDPWQQGEEYAQWLLEEGLAHNEDDLLRCFENGVAFDVFLRRQHE